MISIILPRTIGAILRLAVQDPERDELYVKEANTLAKIYLTHYANLV